MDFSIYWFTDSKGRILILDVKLDRNQFILINIYNVNTETGQVQILLLFLIC